MGTHPTPYPPIANTAIASYNFTDIEDNTGILIYYPFKASDTAVINRMSNQADYTEELGYGVDLNAGVASVFNVLWETGKFNVTKSVRGTAIFRLPWLLSVGISSRVLSGYWVITVYKYDGTTETQIATVTTRNYTTTTGGNIPYNEVSMIELVLPKTNIAVGDTLRVRTQLYAGYTTVGNAGYNDALAIGYDPKDTSFAFTGAHKTSTLNNPQMAFFIPFDLDL